MRAISFKSQTEHKNRGLEDTEYTSARDRTSDKESIEKWKKCDRERELMCELNVKSA